MEGRGSREVASPSAAARAGGAARPGVTAASASRRLAARARSPALPQHVRAGTRAARGLQVLCCHVLNLQHPRACAAMMPTIPTVVRAPTDARASPRSVAACWLGALADVEYTVYGRQCR